MSTEKKAVIGIGLLTLAILVGGVFFLSKSVSTSSSIPQTDIVAQNGLHWHPKLTIYINGEKKELDDKIGLGAVHQRLHTHTEDFKNGIVHMEMKGIVTKDETKLGKFFIIWGKEFNATQIFDKKNGEERSVKMIVNGKENTEFENYKMRDNDTIEIRYDRLIREGGETK